MVTFPRGSGPSVKGVTPIAKEAGPDAFKEHGRFGGPNNEHANRNDRTGRTTKARAKPPGLWRTGWPKSVQGGPGDQGKSKGFGGPGGPGGPNNFKSFGGQIGLADLEGKARMAVRPKAKTAATRTSDAS